MSLDHPRFSSAVADAAETMDVVSASQIICSEMAVGYFCPYKMRRKTSLPVMEETFLYVSRIYGRFVF